MTSQDVEVIEKSVMCQGYFRIDRYRLRHRRHDGGWSGVLTREVFERGHAAGVLLYDPVRDAVALVEQFRVGALAAGWPAWLVEPVAGIIDDGESVEDVARREAWEEAGAELAELIPIHRYLVSPGGTSETMALYCALTDVSTLGGLHGVAEEGEDIRVVVMGVDEALSRLHEPAFANVSTLLAMTWLALNRDRLRQDA